MFGYGRGYRGFGYGAGYGRGFHHNWRWPGPASAQVPEGYKYIGPCRCGWGPHAFYQDASGRIVQARDVYRRSGVPGPAPTQDELKEELEALKAEKEELERRIAELEKQFKEESKKS
ncbi:MAG: hypothetical protein ACUVRL_03640 [Candidatus Saccharicenans sp.]|uniref:hypothetical protein n=1 Tax=Candidatus Saccharicenans sp. TaxID=2819258 RepID=UPI00404A6FAF